MDRVEEIPGSERGNRRERGDDVDLEEKSEEESQMML